jgi:hypothetical protein
MKYKLLSFVILIFILIIPAVGQTEVSPSPEKIQTFIPQPLIEIFKIFSNLKIDFSRLPFINKVTESIPKSGEEVADIFQWLTRGLGNINDWLKTHIGLNIILVIKKIGELFLWIFEGIANLIRIGLSFIK